MNYHEFRSRIAHYPYFRSNIFGQLTPKIDLLRSQLVGWVKKGYVYELKRGIYTLNDDDRKAKLTPDAIASILYSPSYITLEYALSFYQMIPERVTVITLVTTKKTQQFSNRFGHFTYRHIKKSCFQGFVQRADEFGNPFLIATPEKALLDYIYFHPTGTKKVEKNWFKESLRLQNIKILDMKKLHQFAKLFQQKKLMNYLTLLENIDD